MERNRVAKEESNINSNMDRLSQLREKIRRVAQDQDVDDKKGTQPKKYYSGVDKKKKSARDAHFKKGASMSDDNPNAYKYAPGDLDKDGKPKKTKVSKHTKKYQQMFGEELKGSDRSYIEKRVKMIDQLEDKLLRMRGAKGTKEAQTLLQKARFALEDVLEDPLNEEDNLPDIEDLNIPELDEGKLVAPFSQILDAIANRFKKEAGKRYQSNPEKGLAFINKIGSSFGAKATDKKQMKNYLFLKMDLDPEELEEKAPNTADAMKRYKSGKAGFTDKAHLKAKGLIPRADGTKKKSPKYEEIEENKKLKQKLSKIKGLTKDQLQMLLAMPPVTLQTVINQLSTLMMSEKLGKDADAGDYIDDFRKSDAPQFKGKSDKKIRDMAIAAYLDSKEKK
tara:strand:+ start:517 stop:1695 length:1179 start_codon:yes stop_codon:yes gene_type:complete